jgi:branched-chain amino acid transport system permease protein
MESFLHQVLSGLANGGVYASLALALVMIYRATHLVNFAQGELALCSTYVASALIGAGTPYWVAFVATVAVSFLAGMAIERALIRPATRAPVLSVVIVFIGLMVALNSFVLLAALYGFFRFTTLGLALRAAAENPQSSRLAGIRVGRMLALGWGLAAAVGAVAGMMIAPIVFLDPSMMSGVMLYAFAAALLGGIDSPGGAALGGFVVGVLENLVGAYVVGTELKLTVALALIVGVLVVRPSGLFGTSEATRV